jgi:hypothetical protein|tara:strand:- start:157 stop:462 length:306 start_codon:yes stop_codon:yes gene_type:complete
MSKRFDPKELENSKRIYKSATPKQDLSWYVKWCASAFILIAVVARSAGIEYHMIDVWFSLVGTMGWLTVGLLWKDRALIMLNAVIVTVLAQSIVRGLVGLV